MTLSKEKLYNIAFAVLLVLFVPFPKIADTKGLYNSWSGLIYCQPSACVHEVGHKLDDMGGFVSKTDEFQIVVSSMGLDLWENQQENYAELFDLAGGKKENMPASLHKFYDWELAEGLLNGIRHRYL